MHRYRSASTVSLLTLLRRAPVHLQVSYGRVHVSCPSASRRFLYPLATFRSGGKTDIMPDKTDFPEIRGGRGWSLWTMYPRGFDVRLQIANVGDNNCTLCTHPADYHDYHGSAAKFGSEERLRSRQRIPTKLRQRSDNVS